jgi:FixJ family two-component response regulator
MVGARTFGKFPPSSVASSQEVLVLSLEQAATSRTTGQTEPWIAIVDDDASIRCSLARVFRVDGIRVDTFASAEEFLERAIAGDPQCVVLDVHLGALSGFDLQDRLAENGVVPPIIFITAHDEIPSARLTRRAGACGFLRKPFDAEALIALVRPFLCRETAEMSER